MSAEEFFRSIGPCHLVNEPVIDKHGATRAAQGGWTHARCANCPLELWIPKGGSYTLLDSCRHEEKVSQGPPPQPRP